MIPLIFPTIDLKDIFRSYLHKGRLVDRSGVLAKNYGKNYGYFVSEGREALAMALEDLGLTREDEVIVPSYVCDIVPKIVDRYATVRYADINPSTLVVDAEEIKNRITKKTKAVVVVHLYGKVNDLKEIHDLCREKNITLIEDCAQAVYSFEGKTRAGSLGDYSILSFRFSKDVNLGKGGALLSNKKISTVSKSKHSLSALVTILFMQLALRSQGLFVGRIYYYAKEYLLNPFFSKTSYIPKKIRRELSPFEQELVLEGLKKMPDVLNKKKQVVSMYESNLKGIDAIDLCDLTNNSFMRFNILASNRQALIRKLHQNGIESDKMYPYCMNRTCKKSLEVSQSIVNLPVHPGVSKRHVEKISRIIRQHYA